MTKITQTPDRIFASPIGSSVQDPSWLGQRIGTYREAPDAEATEYMRIDLVEEAVRQEREGCAFAVETHSGFGDWSSIECCAALVRARGDEPDDCIHVLKDRYAELLAIEAAHAETAPPEQHVRTDLYDADAFMADGEIPMTAAENVLAWLLVEKIGVVDDISYSPKDAQEIIVANLDQAAKQLVEGGELLLQAEAIMSEMTKLLQEAKNVIASASDSYKKRNGHLASFQDDSGEKCWIVPFDAFEGLRHAVAGLTITGHIPRLPVGTPVNKDSGYPFPGIVVSAFHTLSGQERFVVEATGEAYAGLLHIYNGGQLRVITGGPVRET